MCGERAVFFTSIVPKNSVKVSEVVRIPGSSDSLSVLLRTATVCKTLHLLLSCCFAHLCPVLVVVECLWPWLILVSRLMHFFLLPDEFETIEDTGSCMRGDGRGFSGLHTKTTGNKDCQSWELDFPHKHPMLPDIFPTDLKKANSEQSCRNPGGIGDRPWCYTEDLNVRWDYCDIPKCGQCLLQLEDPVVDEIFFVYSKAIKNFYLLLSFVVELCVCVCKKKTCQGKVTAPRQIFDQI